MEWELDGKFSAWRRMSESSFCYITFCVNHNPETGFFSQGQNGIGMLLSLCGANNSLEGHC